MTDGDTSASTHLSVVMTTTEDTGITIVTSSSSRGARFYFQLFVLIIGVVGTAANGLVLYALVASKQHKKHVLIVNQNVLDLFACISLVITYSVKLSSVYFTGSTGYWLCMFVASENLIWCGCIGSIINLAIISVERYLKVVHPVWSKKNLRNWMIYLAMAFAWLGSIIYNVSVVFPTTVVVNGKCSPYVIFKNQSLKFFHLFWDFVSFYVIILLIFIFCYGRILVAVRRQARVMAGHSAAGSSAGQSQFNHIQTNVIKTMILVCLFYAIFWLPKYILLLLMKLNQNPYLRQPFIHGYYGTLFLAFLYISTNPLIYAIKFDPVKQVLVRMIYCKTSEQVVESDVSYRSGRVHRGTATK